MKFAEYHYEIAVIYRKTYTDYFIHFSYFKKEKVDKMSYMQLSSTIATSVVKNSLESMTTFF
jgi:hypothetical protein